MSTFSGNLEEEKLDFIAIDCFQPKLYECSMFLLSHAHEDHMCGLYDETFQEVFNNTKNNMVLYASPLTITYLKRNKKINLIEEKLIPLEVGFSHLLEVNSDKINYISLTLLSAGHCPGSVMFLIEADEHCFLYTGDFRIQLEDFKQLKPLLMNKEGYQPKRISSLYLDTTFASKNYYEFPLRKESSINLINVIEEWLARDSNNKICLWMPGYIGIEYGIVEVAKHFKTSIHVHRQKYEELYSSIAALDNYVTPNLTANRIHACSKQEGNADPTNCFKSSESVKCVQLNALAFTSDVIKTNGHVFVKNNITRVCYSSHPSCKELREIIKFLKPKKLYFNVMVKQTHKEIYNILTENNWAPPELLTEEKEKNTKPVFKLSNKFVHSFSAEKSTLGEILKRPRLESPERD